MSIYNVTDEYKNILLEGTIYKGTIKKNSYCIFSDAQLGRNFEYDPYIKVYNNKSKNDATGLIRISMKTGKAVDHKNSGKDAGKIRIKYTKEIAEFLEKAMMEPPINKSDYPEEIKTVYDAIYYDILRVTGKCTKYLIPNFKENIEK